jgi:hypothetical protein
MLLTGMLLIKESLVQIDRQIRLAAAGVRGDTKATVRLVAAVEAFREKSRDLMTELTTAGPDQVRQGIVELERLGALARAAAEADQAALEYTCRRVVNAHHWIDRLRQKAVERRGQW